MTSKYSLLVYFYNNINFILKIKNLSSYSNNSHNLTSSHYSTEITEAIIQNNNTPKIGNIYYCKLLKYQVNLNCYFVDLGNNNFGLLKYHRLAALILKKPTIGQKFLVIIIKEASESKYPLVSPYIILQGLYSNFLPFDNNITFNNNLDKIAKKSVIIDKITTEETKFQFGIHIKNLDNIQNLIQEINIKKNLWKKISKNINGKIGLIYSCPPILQLLIEDPQNIPNNVYVNSLSSLELIKNEIINNIPFLDINIKYTDLSTDYIKYLELIEKKLNNHIQVKEDITLNIYSTKALTFIDIDFKGNNNLKKEEALLQANIEAIIPITKLIKFRNISGQIFIDILKVKNKNNKEIILQMYREAFASHNLQAIILGFTKLGILEIEKSKKNTSLEDNYYHSCATCNGTGKVINFTLLNIKAIIEIQNLLHKNPLTQITIKSSNKNIMLFKSYNNSYIKQLNANKLKFIIDNELINCIIIY